MSSAVDAPEARLDSCRAQGPPQVSLPSAPRKRRAGCLPCYPAPDNSLNLLISPPAGSNFGERFLHRDPGTRRELCLVVHVIVVDRPALVKGWSSGDGRGDIEWDEVKVGVGDPDLGKQASGGKEIRQTRQTDKDDDASVRQVGRVPS